MRIRPATPEDAEMLAEAERQTTAAQEGLLASRPEEIHVESFRRKIEQLQSNGLYVVLEKDGAPVGHLLLEPLALAVTSHVVQLTIVVHPGHTGQGYGRVLMNHAIEWARQSPAVGKIELRVRSSNPRAIAFYRSLGFEIEGTLKRRIKLSQSYADDICMALFVDQLPRLRSPRRPDILIRGNQQAGRRSDSMATLRVGPYIDGQELADGGGGTFDVIDPATGQTAAVEACCDTATVDRAVDSGAKAFASSAWRATVASARGRMLLKLADLVEEHAEELIELELLDVGKPISQLRGGEIPLTAAIIRYYAGAADKIEGCVKTAEGGSFALTTYEPYGVVAGILPWNYPLVNAALKVAPAIAAGNAIVLKPSIETPLSTVAFARICSEAGLPPGIVNVVLGSGSKVGNPLVSHPAVKKVSFTGSTAVGQAIQKLAADQMKKVNLECGGKNAILVFADADLERAAQAALISAFVNCGQLCVSCSRLLVEASIADEFVAIMVAKLARAKVGNPRDDDTLIGPMITRAQYETALDYLKIAREEGCKPVCGGGLLEMEGPLSGGLWIQPTILTGVVPGMRVHDEEIFGPVLSVVPFENEAQAVEISGRVEYGLSGSIWTSDGERALRVARALDTGIIWINSMLNGYPQISVPPHKMSGTGVELGMEGLLAYCKQKSLVIGYDPAGPVGWGL